MNYVRASLLPGYNDCARRQAAKQWPQFVRDAGHTVRALPPSVGAAIGTAVHRAAQVYQAARIAGGAVPDEAAAVQVALAEFREEIKTGAEWDDTTPNVQAADIQIGGLFRSYLTVARAIVPAAAELPLKAAVAPGWELTGTVDLITATGRVDDLKTGAVRRPYQAQLGAYSLLARTHGYDIREVGTTWIKRVRAKADQPAPEVQSYDIAVAESVAAQTIESVVTDVEKFQKSGDPGAFRANPMSMMCSPRYCPAHGTSFCKLHISHGGQAVD